MKNSEPFDTKTTRERFNRLLDAMAHGERPSGKRKAKGGTSDKDASADCAGTRTHKGTSAGASSKPKRESP